MRTLCRALLYAYDVINLSHQWHRVYRCWNAGCLFEQTMFCCIRQAQTRQTDMPALQHQSHSTLHIRLLNQASL